MMKIIFSLILIAAINIFSQSERLTRNLENGYAWVRLEDPVLNFSTSKETYLSSILQRYRLTQEKYPEISHLGCKNEIDKIYQTDESDKMLMSNIISEMDKFYNEEENMIIPIIFVYCYTIKKIAGLSEADLNDYKKAVLEFSEE